MTNEEKTIVPGNEEVVTPEKPSEETIPAKEVVTA